MIQVTLLVGLGLLLLIFLGVWAWRSAGPSVSVEGSSRLRDALADMKLAVPPRHLAERIFSREDWEFVSQQSTPQVGRLFLQERRRIALSWLRETRKRVREVLNLHRRVAREDPSLQPVAEIVLGVNYASFLLTHTFLYGLIWLRGPFSARRVVSLAADGAERLSLLGAELLVRRGSLHFPEVSIDGPDE